MTELLIALAIFTAACLAPVVFAALCVAFHLAPAIAARFLPNPYLLELQELKDENAALRENVKTLTTDTVEFIPVADLSRPCGVQRHLSAVSDDFPTAS